MSDAGGPRWRDGGTIGVVVHPSRELDRVLDATRRWAEAQGGTMAQVAVDGNERRVADEVDAERCDLLLALGGDGTVLAALKAGAPSGRAVLGVACGSLGALTSVQAPDVASALDRFAAGRFETRVMPGLEVDRDGERIGTAFNDVVVIRDGAGQVIFDVSVDGGTYARIAGDGLVVATPHGSSAYTLSAGGPLLATEGVVLTPLPSHGGFVPPMVVAASSTVTLTIDGGWSGARIEVDGRVVGTFDGPGESEPFELRLDACPQTATLLDFDDETLVAGLRRRGVIADSPRLALRDARPGERR